MFSITTRYTCLLLIACQFISGAYCWNPYQALEYRTFNDPPMDPGLALAMTQQLSGPLVSPITGYMSDQTAASQLSAPFPPVNQANQAAIQDSPAPEVKSVLSKLESTALEVAQNATANIAQEMATNVVQNAFKSQTPVADSSLAAVTPSTSSIVEPSVVPQETPAKTELAGPVNSPEVPAAKQLSAAGKILSELVNSKNASERFVNVAFQLLKPRKQESASHKSHMYAEQQIISQHADMFQRQLLQPTKHRDTSGASSQHQSDGARNSPLGSVLSNFKASKGISSRSSIVRMISDNKLARGKRIV